ncbi:phosphatase PAP2 family protein [Actinoplanes bogorensis]|uniref:Phosphatase PAP2 family protein n=1 Tax=Paractinoplanes bogorensis TaxID=1610840 RepID=A0ABS5YZ64_9ACTN|nr:phosphatase PAP2 family protein [Actinoplanes bogorensis]MBU2667984.1 phosphatase PAP2 family protein [Actinoplanes bogorensis]
MNYHLFELINGAAGRRDGVDDLMEFAATWLVYPVFAVLAVLAGLSLRRRQWQPVAQLGAALVAAFAMAQVLAHVSNQVRPFQSHPVHQLIAHGPGVSLPSDHATAAFAIAFGVYAFLSHRWGLALTGAALVIGFARIWVGVHYPGDVLAGAVIALLAVLEVLTAVRMYAVRGDRRYERI